MLREALVKAIVTKFPKTFMEGHGHGERYGTDIQSYMPPEQMVRSPRNVIEFNISNAWWIGWAVGNGTNETGEFLFTGSLPRELLAIAKLGAGSTEGR